MRLARGDEPVDEIDACALDHDREYQQISDAIRAGKLSRDKVLQLVRASDVKLMNCLKQSRKFRGSSFLRSFIVQKIIHAKTKLEDLGVMDAQKFVAPNPNAPVTLSPEDMARAKEMFRNPFMNTVHNLEPQEAEPQQGSGKSSVVNVMAPMNDEPPKKRIEYKCCESCDSGLPFCEKLPAYKLRMAMMKRKK